MSTHDDARRPRVIREAARRRWWLVLLCGALGALLALAVSQVRDTSYVAHAGVLVSPVAGTPFNTQLRSDLLTAMSSEAQLVRSDGVATLAAGELVKKDVTPPSTAALIGHVEATVESNTQVLNIAYRASTPAAARDGANAFAVAYLAYRKSLAEIEAQRAIADIDDQRVKAERALDSLRNDLDGALPGSGDAGRINTLINSEIKTLIDLAQQKNLYEEQKTVPGQLLSPASLPRKPAGIGRNVLVALGLLGGLLAGLFLASARHGLSGRIRKPESLPDPPPLFGRVRAARGAVEPILRTAPDSAAAEDYRLVAAALDAAIESGPADTAQGTVIVVAPVSGSAPPVATNVAFATAAAGRLTTLVEAVPTLADRMVPPGLVPADAPGLADSLLTGADAVVNRVHGGRGLTLLGPGPQLDRAAEGYVGPRMRTALGALRRASDLVLLTSPPLSDPDGQALAAVSDGVLLVVTLDVSSRAEFDRALADAAQVRADVIGVVAVHAAPPLPVAASAAPAVVEPQILTPDQPPSATRVGT